MPLYGPSLRESLWLASPPRSLLASPSTAPRYPVLPCDRPTARWFHLRVGRRYCPKAHAPAPRVDPRSDQPPHRLGDDQFARDRRRRMHQEINGSSPIAAIPRAGTSPHQAHHPTRPSGIGSATIQPASIFGNRFTTRPSPSTQAVIPVLEVTKTGIRFSTAVKIALLK